MKQKATACLTKGMVDRFWSSLKIQVLTFCLFLLQQIRTGRILYFGRNQPTQPGSPETHRNMLESCPRWNGGACRNEIFWPFRPERNDCYLINCFQCLRPLPVHPLKHIFSIFKQYYIYFYTFFHIHIFLFMFLKTYFQFLNSYTKHSLNRLVHIFIRFFNHMYF